MFRQIAFSMLRHTFSPSIRCHNGNADERTATDMKIVSKQQQKRHQQRWRRRRRTPYQKQTVCTTSGNEFRHGVLCGGSAPFCLQDEFPCRTGIKHFQFSCIWFVALCTSKDQLVLHRSSVQQKHNEHHTSFENKIQHNTFHIDLGSRQVNHYYFRNDSVPINTPKSEILCSLAPFCGGCIFGAANQFMRCLISSKSFWRATQWFLLFLLVVRRKFTLSPKCAIYTRDTRERVNSRSNYFESTWNFSDELKIFDAAISSLNCMHAYTPIPFHQFKSVLSLQRNILMSHWTKTLAEVKQNDEQKMLWTFVSTKHWSNWI